MGLQVPAVTNCSFSNLFGKGSNIDSKSCMFSGARYLDLHPSQSQSCTPPSIYHAAASSIRPGAYGADRQPVACLSSLPVYRTCGVDICWIYARIRANLVSSCVKHRQAVYSRQNGSSFCRVRICVRACWVYVGVHCSSEPADCLH